MYKIFFFLFTFITFQSNAQKITGTIYNDKGDLLPYSSITIKGTSNGASANINAQFSLSLSPGTYTLICQHIGFTKQEKTIEVKSTNEEITFILTDQKLNMGEVIVKSGGEDLAYKIIRQAIKKRKFYNEQVKDFTCNLYTKDLMKLSKFPDKFFGKKIKKEDKKDMGIDSTGKGIIYLSESEATIYSQKPNKFKMDVHSSRVSGSDGFGFTFPAIISLYKNNVMVFIDKINPRGFISPIADNALSLYNYKFMGSFFEDGKEINSIKVTPKREYEPLFSGTINITEADWRIHSFDLILTKTAQLEIIDTLQITQLHVPITQNVWQTKSQLLHFNFKKFGFDAIGNFASVYSNYNIQPVFDKHFFNKIIIKYDTGVNKKTRIYWDSIRPIPLEVEEKKDYSVKDSIFDEQKSFHKSKNYADSMNKKQGKLKLYSLVWKRKDRYHFGKDKYYSWGIDPLLQSLEYNTVEGLTLNINGEYNSYLSKIKQNIVIEPNIRYGFNNTHFNAWLTLKLRTNDIDANKKYKRQSWTIAGGKRVSQFNKDNPITTLSNTINTLFWADNYMKIYENYFGNIGFTKQFEFGLHFKINTLFEDRIPINNTTNFTIFKSDSGSLTPNYPVEKLTQQFTRYQAAIVSVELSYKPGQKYIQFPNSKISIGSKYPTFTLKYTKGFPNVLSSDVNFDKWQLGIKDDKNFRILGLLKYKLGIGGFLNTKALFIHDIEHLKGNRSTSASEYVNSYQLTSYYANGTDANFYTNDHVEHHFNGLLTNKIPLFKKLNWHLVVGANVFYASRGNNYAEMFAGFENIFKIFRVDIVTSYVNGKNASTGFRIGTGGILGGNFKVDKASKSMTFNF